MRNPSTAKNIAPKLYTLDASFMSRGEEFIECYTALTPDGVDELKRIAAREGCRIDVAGMKVILSHPKIEA